MAPKSNENSSGLRSVAASPHWTPYTRDTDSKGFSPFVAFCFTLNYILGTGFLTIPWAFAQGGLFLSAFVLMVVGILSDVAKGYVLETMARAEAMLDPTMHWKSPVEEKKPLLMYSPVMTHADIDNERGSCDRDNVDLSSHSHGPQLKIIPSDKGIMSAYGSIGNSLMMPTYPAPPTTTNSAQGTPKSGEEIRRLRRQLISIKSNNLEKGPVYYVKDRKFEVNALCRVFLGKYGLHIYTLFLCLYIYCTLWAYTCVFASAMASTLPMFSDGDKGENYVGYALVFAVMVVPMSCLEMDEQVGMQVFLAGCRFAMVFLMVVTSSICKHDEFGNDAIPEAAPLVCFEGFYKMLPIIVFATIYHHSIPGLSNPVGNKKELGEIFLATNTFSSLSYAFIGITLGLMFGTGIEQSSNLNWEGFHGGTGFVGEDGKRVGVALWAKVVGIFVVCFPAIDVVSAFPLNAITLGNNMMGAVFGKEIHEVEKNRWIVSTFRVLASFPPIILGIVFRKLGTITDYAGTSAFIITFCFPALLYLYSRKKASKKGFSTKTGYATFGSSNLFAIFLFTFGIAMFLFVSVLVSLE